MVAFLTPTQMFQEYQMHAHIDYEAERFDYENGSYKEMCLYAIEAGKYIEHYHEIIAEAYIQGCRKAEALFDKHGLKLVHAFALLDNLKEFTEEFEETERREPDYD